MPADKMQRFAESEGFCCPWALLISRKRWLTSALTEDSGMSSRAIRYWRRAVRKGEVCCANCKGCLVNRIRLEQGLSVPPRKTP